MELINNSEELEGGGLIVRIDEKTRQMAYIDVKVFIGGREVKGITQITIDSESVEKIRKLHEKSNLPSGDRKPKK